MASSKCYGCKNYPICHLTKEEITKELETSHLDPNRRAIEEIIEEVENSFALCSEMTH